MPASALRRSQKTLVAAFSFVRELELQSLCEESGASDRSRRRSRFYSGIRGRGREGGEWAQLGVLHSGYARRIVIATAEHLDAGLEPRTALKRRIERNRSSVAF